MPLAVTMVMGMCGALSKLLVFGASPRLALATTSDGGSVYGQIYIWNSR